MKCEYIRYISNYLDRELVYWDCKEVKKPREVYFHRNDWLMAGVNLYIPFYYKNKQVKLMTWWGPNFERSNN